jgi:penicillin-binding protein 1A
MKYFTAFLLEYYLSKDQIIEIYLNTAFMGSGVRGMEAAARKYFGYSFKKEAAQIGSFTPHMAAMLAVTLSAPSLRNPAKPPQIEILRRLLIEMRRAGAPVTDAMLVDEAIIRAARRLTSVRGKGEAMPRRFSFYRDAAVREIRLNATGLAPARAVEAALSYRSVHQLYLERAEAQFRRRFKTSAVDYPRLFAVVIDLATGGVTAQIGDAARMYPASLTKPFIYACALRDGATPDSRLRDAPLGLNPPIRNSYTGYAGEITLQAALARSTNTVPVGILLERGVGCLRGVFKDIGFGAPWLTGSGRDLESRTRSMALGAEPVPIPALIDSYLALATCGAITRHRRVGAIWSVSDGSSQRLEGVSSGREAAGWIDDAHSMMRAVAHHGTARGLIVDRPIAAKTGTADGYRQFSIVTFTNRYLVLMTLAADPGRRPGKALASGTLVETVRSLNANLHLGEPIGALGCRRRTGKRPG